MKAILPVDLSVERRTAPRGGAVGILPPGEELASATPQ